ncbi:FkbM family methyltransferase [candidate division WWE3 bacterium]|uniref:FkbM family methyltransferase n=1 Tax=candidate division WWE3 bacterium TaxID=2053526 RepID=A0A3A4ZFH2_UNCKA|nr:MAG: FkbM family methyltransferase [candidate division WWE3 bacterium]
MKADVLYQQLPVTVRSTLERGRAHIEKPYLKKFYSQFVKSDDLVFDIGANMGDYAEVFLELGAQVICLEPQPRCLDIINKKFAGNENITVIGKGVGNSKGVLPFYVSSQNHATSTFSEKYKKEGPFNNRTWDKTIDVEITTIDDLISAYGVPAFCKIDVEGYEKYVFEGLHSIIPIISFEYTSSLVEDTVACLKLLENQSNLKINLSVHPYHRLELPEWTNDITKVAHVINKQKMSPSGDIYVKLSE